LDPSAPLVNQLEALVGMMPDPHDGRDVLGEDRGGRNKAARIAKRVHELALRR
jgi:malonate decarboxylase gamma subunit